MDEKKKKTNAVMVRLDEDTFAILSKIALEDDRTVSSLVRKILTRHLKILKKT